MLKQLNFSVTINAPKETVWSNLWKDASYREWTKVFSEGSHAITDWQEGSDIHFLDASGDGMSSRVAKRIDYTQMSIEHLGLVKDGKEQPADEQTKAWAGAMEEYFLSENNGVTTLNVQMDSDDTFEDYFKKTFPKALNIVKQLSEH